MKRGWLSFLFLVTATSVVAGEDFEFCRKQHSGKTAEGEPVVVCDQLYPERPYVHVPDPRPIGQEATELFLAAVPQVDGVEGTFLDADGHAYSSANLPAWFKYPSNRKLYLLYRIAGKITRGKGTYVLAIAEAAPAVLISGEAIAESLLGEWDAKISKRVGNTPFQQFDRKDLAPIRIKLERLEASGLLERGIVDHPTFPPKKTYLVDGQVFKVWGTIENMDQAIAAGESSTIPALSSLGKKNPLAGATSAKVAFYMDGSMHAPGDNELVFIYPPGTMLGHSAMSKSGLLHPSNFIQKREKPELTSVEEVSHGTPKGDLMTRFKRVSE